MRGTGSVTYQLTLPYSYRRKLKAAKAMNSASHMNDNQKSGAVVPGTNKYTMEGWADNSISINKNIRWIKNRTYFSLCVTP